MKKHKSSLGTAVKIATITSAVIGTVIAVWQLYLNISNEQQQTVNNGIYARGDINVSPKGGSNAVVASGNATVEIGITLKEYEDGLRRQEVILTNKLRESIGKQEQEKRLSLETKLKVINKRLNNLQQSYEDEKQRRLSAINTLEQLKDELPEAKIAEAEKHLQTGETDIAEKLFDSIVDKESPSIAMAAYQSAQLAEGRLDYSKAIRKYRQALILEENNLDYLNSAGIMARTLGYYQEAHLWLEKLLQLCQQKKKGTLSLANAQHQLATLHCDMGKYEKAELLYQRSLKIKEKELGKDHLLIAKTLNNLAISYYQQGKYGKAESLYQRSLKIEGKALGEDHPSVAETMNNLAALYSQQGKYEKVEPLYQRSLQIEKKALGEDHPSVAGTLNNLAELYRQQGKYEKAEPLYQRSLKIKKKAFGEDHLSVARTMNNLAELYRQQGNYEKAEFLYQRSLIILENKLPNGHPDINTVKRNYATMKGD